MRRCLTAVLHALFLSVLMCGLAAQSPSPFRTVAPAAFTDVEGPTSITMPFGSPLARHVMYAIGGAAVDYRRPVFLDAIELRPDGNTPGVGTAGSYSFTLDCSTGRLPATALDATFANNHGPDRLRVFSGTVTVPAPATGMTPNAFALRIPFHKLFEWDPRNGPLILDFVYSASTPAFPAWDAVGAPYAVGGLAAGSPSATVATSLLTVAPIVRLSERGFVLPPLFAAAESPNSQPTPWAANVAMPTRTLDLFMPYLLPFTGPVSIAGLAWRADAGAAFPGDTYELQVVMSTSPNTAASIFPGFEPNHGPDRTIVFQGMLTAPPSPASTDLSHFDLFVEFQRSFPYDPAFGPLVVDVTVSSPTHTTTQFDYAPLLGNAGLARVVQSGGPPAVLPGSAAVIAFRSQPRPAVVPERMRKVVNLNTISANVIPFDPPLVQPAWMPQCRAQYMISAVEACITEPTFVRHLRFRPRSLTGGPATFTGSIDLSNPTNTPASMSTRFDDNHGSNRLTAFAGRFSVPYFTRAPGDSDFPVQVKLERPFLWNPATNPYLTVDLRITDLDGTGFESETTRNVLPDPDDASISDGNPNAVTASIVEPWALVLQLGGEGQNGLAVNYGAGCPGSGGVPQCTTEGLPELPNAAFRIRVRRALGNAPVFLLIGFHAANAPLPGAPGCRVLTTLELGTWGMTVTDPTGQGAIPFPLRSNPAFDRFAFRSQWVVLDPGANPLWLVTSDAQEQVMAFF